ncbi:HEAT repeat domain-containing protein [Streptomyces sp. NBC_01218]|uniref:HEAT repeat domain-containing protein n=1 Tax=unclassified Streptomyces TaxID=2593676 RepID=UPI0023B96FE5|nr:MULTISPECIES: HEAT repeat domain-containing protein [unclassified Streptomyces]WEH40372.1 HEAT repeat domain-containing protein [Streptomyces sp. AM 2-1-1]WSQ52064.1 HEAT repeat domain-containing protein [Streptomyces sp. NBC_01218]
MNRTEKLITEYGTLPQESDRRREIVYELGGMLSTEPDHPGILPFLIGVVADYEALDLARVEATKALRLWPPSDPETWRLAGAVLVSAVEHPDEDLVRQYAVMALSSYADDSVVHAALAEAVLGDHDPLVRDNALAALSEAGPSEGRSEVLRRLSTDAHRGHEAARILTGWEPRPA